MSIFHDTHSIHPQQLNIDIFINIEKAVKNRSLQDCAFMMDNCPDSVGEGSAQLQSYCELGQPINWSIYSLDNSQNLPQSNDALLSIQQIRFEKAQVVELNNPVTSTKLPILSAPIASHWTGNVSNRLPTVGSYRYSLEIKIQPADNNLPPMLLELTSASLAVSKHTQRVALYEYY